MRIDSSGASHARSLGRHTHSVSATRECSSCAPRTSTRARTRRAPQQHP
ncbi:hypothetical protein ACFPRL_05250 [Pseudoclavibacter helvolus]